MNNDLQGSLKQKRQQNAQLLDKVPRKASLKHVLRVNKLVAMLNKRGLRMFQNIHKLAEWGLDKGCLTGKFPDPMPVVPDWYVVPSFAIDTDQEQTQITEGEFIFSPKTNELRRQARSQIQSQRSQGCQCQARRLARSTGQQHGHSDETFG